MTINNWLRTNTYHHSSFSNLKEIIAEKERQNITVSLCIRKEIVIFKSELMNRHHLLDEIAVIDSGSDDKTREIARIFGADVFLASEILPNLGAKKGKGENLWKAIYQLKGDIIVYIDADIKNIHPRFVYGLVAPLIFHPEINYVKAFYDRPLVFSDRYSPCFSPNLLLLSNRCPVSMLCVVRSWKRFPFPLVMVWKHRT
jgi:glucosyl-3-phosphoglycerate synthase